ncbi:unnamed protein product [Rhodiola kirilowii]
MYSPFYSLTSELTITSHSKTNTLKLPGRSTVTSHYIEVASWTAALRRTLFLASKLTKEFRPQKIYPGVPLGSKRQKKFFYEVSSPGNF